MKKLLLIAVLATASYSVQAQMKGTNAMGLGLNFGTTTIDQTTTKSEMKNSAFSVGYGHFIKENEKIGINLFYGNYKSSSVNGNGDIDNGFGWNSYGGTFTYQKYYALFKKLYAFAGPRAGYNYNEDNNIRKINTYSLGGYGGVTWFLSQKIALEADLLAADITYSHTNEGETNSNLPNMKYRSTSFNLNTSGAVNGLGFKIYFLF